MAQQGPRLDDLGETDNRQGPRGRKRTPDWLSQVQRYRLPLVIGGGAILLLLLLSAVMCGSEEQREAAKDSNASDGIEARLNKLEFQHSMVLKKVNEMQESFSSPGVDQKQLAKLRKAVSDLERRLASLEEKLAEGSHGGAAGAPEETTDSGSRQERRRHTVEQGETLFSIGQRYGVSVEQLREWNGIGEEEYIQPGQELKVAGE